MHYTPVTFEGAKRILHSYDKPGNPSDEVTVCGRVVPDVVSFIKRTDLDCLTCRPN